MREGIPIVKRQQSGPRAVKTQPRLINMEELVQMKKGTSCVRGGVFPLPMHQHEGERERPGITLEKVKDRGRQTEKRERCRQKDKNQNTKQQLGDKSSSVLKLFNIDLLFNLNLQSKARQHQECKTVFIDAQDDIHETQGQMKGASTSQIQRCVKILCHSILQALSLFSYGHVGMLMSLYM